jgi:hypothetical protein
MLKLVHVLISKTGSTLVQEDGFDPKLIGKTFIVKVQYPLSGVPNILVYNKDRSLLLMFPVTKEWEELMTMDETDGPEPKLYFKATINKNKSLEILDYAKWQEW